MSKTIVVEGMTCEHCEQTVEETLEDIAGVSSATADREVETASITGDAETQTLVNAVNEQGMTLRHRLQTV